MTGGANANNAQLSYPAYLKNQLEGNMRDVKKSATTNGSALHDGDSAKPQDHAGSNKPTSSHLTKKKKSLTVSGGANQNKNGAAALQQYSHQTNSSHTSQSLMQS